LFQNFKLKVAASINRQKDSFDNKKAPNGAFMEKVSKN